ncbi:venom factor-like [Spea bombifrons]|uniref:venom factor-like n=1 Tax=Spea bombifrons TaxID=233779 RepID=UPI00234A326F|nr:venom factor-like [Spea bombifrons]
MGCRVLCVTLLVLLAGSYVQPQCVLILPNVLRVESEETIILDAQGKHSSFDADIEIQDFPQRKFSLASTKVSINGDNNYLGIVKLTVPSKDLLRDPKKKQFVYVTVKSPFCSLEKVVLLTFQSGYIFLQADKTIYTPGSLVLYRIFTMDYNLQPLSKAVIVEFLHPDGIIVKRDTVRHPSKAGIISLSHRLSELVSSGIWTISARYEDSPQQNYTAKFEVKEYVLPSFEVSLLPWQRFFYFDDENFEVAIKAQFLYGKPVNGKAFVLFGVNVDNIKRGLPDTLRRVSISEGEGECKLKRCDLVKYFRQEEDMVGRTLYVSVTVITDTGSDIVEAELDNIHIVKSPYKILFTKTSKYFKPGMPFDAMVFVTNPDGSPASNVRVRAEPENVEATTQADGTTRLTVNTPTGINSLTITAKTADPALLSNRQASATMTATAYKPLGGIENYLHIGIAGTELKPGESVAVNFNIRNSDAETQNQISHFTYLIINKGRIISVDRKIRQAGQSLVTMSLEITKIHIPSFRIVAYYIVQTSAGREIVSDSVWVDVTDTCMGTLVVTGDKESDNRVQFPGSQMKLRLRADHGASVGLVAVDKGVFVLNNKLKITQTKVWDSVEKSDIGCTPGSGADSMGVFFDAGLAVQTDFKISTTQRSEPECDLLQAVRYRSSAVLLTFKATKASTYNGLPRKCCEDGMKVNPMGHSCQKRSGLILDGKECVDAFLDCCNHFTKKREEERRLKDDDDMSRSEEDDEYMPDTDIVSRTEFPESWLWKVEQMSGKPDANGISSKVLNIFLKDSITTWEVLAVSVAENKGICVGQPYEIQVMKDFFIDLRLPYSVVRNEQVEIRAVLYNYGNLKIKARVELTYNPEFCSLSTHKKKFRQEIWIKPHSSTVVPFIIVPLTLGQHDIEVKASIANMFMSDGVRRKLKVVPEGLRLIHTLKSVILEPEVKGTDGVQREKVSALNVKNIVPQTDIETIVTIQGTPISQMIEDAIDGANLNHFINLPRGCGEQIMVTMTSCVIATIYLDTTNQWEKIGLDRREKAISHIKSGYEGEMAFRKSDNSYAIYRSNPSSTWLTAYVAKVFAMAQTLIDIDSNVLCGAIKWLVLEKQKPDGLFKETAPVHSRAMTGGLKTTTDPDAALTAFVLIAMLESEKVCGDYVNNLKGSIEKATSFLADRYPKLTKPYSVAIASYALAMAGVLKETKTLMAASTDNTHWVEEGAHHITQEATSYALLALLRMKEYKLTSPIVRWLNEQRFQRPSDGSTQAIILLFQALAQYQTDFPTVADLALDVSIHLPERQQPLTHRINLQNALWARSAETRINKDFMVEAKGKGQGTLNVVTVYYGLVTEKEKECNNFHLSVKVHEEHDVRQPEGAVSTISLEICARHLKNVDATMSIIDVSMLTGFAPDVESLNKLANGVDKYISKFEISTEENDKGTLIIYLDKISHTEEECIKLYAHQLLRVGLIQPASVTVYDYYSPESRCTKFYHPVEGSNLLGKICQGDVCRCAEENCFMRQRIDEEVTAELRMEKACEPGVDYVYKAVLLRIEEKENFDNYVLKILRVIKQGTDEDVQDKERYFISHRKCRDKLEMQVGRDYLIWGVSSDLWSQPSGYSYIIGKDTWIEWWPTDRECQNPENQELCEVFLLVSENLEMIGCPT